MASLLSRSRLWPLLLRVVLISAAVSSPAMAQSLGEVDAHLREGRLQEARSSLLAWEAANPTPDRAARQRALWLRGLLTLDPEDASSSYARLIVEYPGGPFTDRALLRLAMAADLRGDAAEAAVHYAQLARDHPTSPLQARAEQWLRNHPEVNADPAVVAEPVAVGDPETEGAAGSPGDPETPSTSDTGSGEASAEGEGYTVQLGAFSDRRWADDLAGRLEDAGFEPRVVRLGDDALLRVRIGRYRTRAEALMVRDEARAAGFEAYLSADTQRETSGA